ncbi:protein of unknown function [bacterium A37T11]|nr:protein of unknown function [bacterium A37T11]
MNVFSNILILAVACTAFASCHDDDDDDHTIPNQETVYDIQGDQVGRPGLNVVFISEGDKDKFNETEPSAMASLFGAQIKSKLLALNPDYTTNKIGLNADQFSGALSTDVLNVSLNGPTTYYDGTNVLTGRKLEDDVIDDSFTLIFGGPNGTAKPGLVSDHVDHNDKDFLSAFPYEAAPW